MSPRLLSAAAVTVLLLGLAACDDGEEGPVTTAPPSIDIGAPSDGGGDTSPSDGGGAETETEDPSASAPDIPAPDPADFAGMDEHTPEGAKQALRYYIAVAYWGHQTGSTKAHESLFSEGCGTCNALNSEIVKISEDETYWTQTDITDHGIQSYEADNFDIEVGYIYTIEEHAEPQPDAKSPAPTRPTTYTAAAGLDWVDGSWLVGGLNISETEIDVRD